MANEAKEFGEKFGFDALTHPKLPLTDKVTGYMLSMLACGISEKNYGYYPCKHPGGAAFVALYDLPEKFFAPVDPSGFISTVMNAISLYELDHKILVEGFLSWNGTDYHWEDNNIYAIFADNSGQLIIRFEDIGDKKRIQTIDGLRR